MGSKDYFLGGSWNARCDICDFKFKAHELRKRWDGLMVCAKDWEPRQPQDFVRGVRDQQPLPWSRPGAKPIFREIEDKIDPADYPRGDGL